ncbi:hypothetical protein ACWF94_04815 [Streptomyces sp. NPDC055078]
MNLFRAAAVTAAAVGMTVSSLSAASAAPAPAFLSARQLPASLTPWVADPVKPGPADDFCTNKSVPRAGTKHRTFRTELDTGARQTITVAATEAKAKALVTKVRASVESCLDRLKRQHPGLDGEALYYGRINVEEGAHVYSIDTAHPQAGTSDVALYSVGRDGRAVTVIGWGQLGDLDGAPLDDFKKTTRTAVAKLY